MLLDHYGLWMDTTKDYEGNKLHMPSKDIVVITLSLYLFLKTLVLSTNEVYIHIY